MHIVGLLALVMFFPAYAHAAVIFTEVMYDYPGAEGSKGDHDWVEVYNNGQSSIDLGGSAVRFMERGHNHTITSFGGNSTILAPGAIAVIASNPTQVKLDFPNTGLLFDSSFSLTGTTTALGIIIDGVNVDPISYTPVASASDLGNSLQFENGSWVAASPTPGVYADASSSSDNSSSNVASTEAATTSSSSTDSGTPEYLPIPALHSIGAGDRTVSSGADTSFTVSVYDGKGNKRDDAVVTWTFGDGMRRTGASVFHKYYNPGEYLAVVRATTPDGGNIQKEIVVTVKDAGIKITAVSSRGIALTNTDSRTLDLSLWRLSSEEKEFKIPEDTQILAGHTILFPAQVIELPLADSAFLLYPSGEIASTYSSNTVTANTNAAAQPSADTTSYKQVQTVEPITSIRTDAQSHEEAVLAPAAATELAAAGAAVQPAPLRTSGIVKSPWTLGFLGVMVLAGGAFILL